MRIGYNSIELTSSIWKDPRPVRVVLASIEAIGQDGTDPNGGAWIATSGGGQYKVRESYEQVLAKVRRA